MSSKLLCSMAALVAALAMPACNRCDPDPVARGSAAITWSITTVNRPATCAEVGAASVSLLLHPRSGADVVSAFACTDAHGVTSPVPAGAYDATLTLRAGDGSAIATGAPQTAVTIGAGQVAELVPVAFDAPARGTLVLTFTALTAIANCKARDQGGAALTGFALILEHAVGGCAPVTLTRARGTTTIGTYTISCSNPAVTSCVERDETLTVDGIQAGPYALGVRGLIGPNTCWSGTDVLLVPGGATLTKPIEFGPRPFPGC